MVVPFGGVLAASLEPGPSVTISPATGHLGSGVVQLAVALYVRKVSQVQHITETMAICN